MRPHRMRFNVARHRFGRRAALQEQDEPFYRLEAVFIGDAEAVERPGAGSRSAKD